jgi:TrmH family RNA methyltransferase
MIPLYKLEKLPRSQRLRKTAKILGEAEYRLGQTGGLPGGEIVQLGELLRFLMNEAPPDTLQALKTAEAALQNPEYTALLRSLNTVRHSMLRETGKFPADWDFIDHSGRLDPRARTCFPGMKVYLEDVRSPFNIGAMFRTAESFGAERLYLSPLCADPSHPRALRTAMGCAGILPWERLPELTRLTDAPESPAFALETGGIPLENFPFPRRGLMIVGSEELGASPQALTAADRSLGRVSIPSYGAKGSLNAAIAFGIAMQAWAAALRRTAPGGESTGIADGLLLPPPPHRVEILDDPEAVFRG